MGQLESVTDFDHSNEGALGWGPASAEEKVNRECDLKGFLQTSGQAVRRTCFPPNELYEAGFLALCTRTRPRIGWFTPLCF